MRNLLGEFRKTPGATIVGFREHIFTGQLSSLASYMALQASQTIQLAYCPRRALVHERYGGARTLGCSLDVRLGSRSQSARDRADCRRARS
eukprot:scaffold107329_cov30-Tisochrysis_lutea.AAC.6